MDTRDQFALAALAGLLAADAAASADSFGAMTNHGLVRSACLYARCAYELADAMMAERAAKTPAATQEDRP